MSDLRSRALSALRDGRVTILHARTRRTDRTPCELVAVVQGFTGKHVVDYDKGAWTCNCDNPPPCAHVAAVALVTGHESPAAKPAKVRRSAAA